MPLYLVLSVTSERVRGALPVGHFVIIKLCTYHVLRLECHSISGLRMRLIERTPYSESFHAFVIILLLFIVLVFCFSTVLFYFFVIIVYK